MKRIENRSWPTNYRGELAIHAGKSRRWMHAVPALIGEGRMPAELLDARGQFRGPFGAIIGTVEVIDCLPNTHASVRDDPFTDPTPGGYCWILRNAHHLKEPVPCSGALNLWEYHSLAVGI